MKTKDYTIKADLKQRDVEALDFELLGITRLTAVNSFSNKSAFLKAAVAAKWFEQECKVKTYTEDGESGKVTKKEYILDGVEVGDFAPQVAYRLGAMVHDLYESFTTIPPNLT